jgi:hypothetical protein
MSFRVRPTTNEELAMIVERLTSPTRASITRRFDFDVQAALLGHIRLSDPLAFQCRVVNSNEQLSRIVQRLVRPTTASIASSWDFDCQDANLLFLRRQDPKIRLPLKTMRPEMQPAQWVSAPRSGTRRFSHRA